MTFFPAPAPTCHRGHAMEASSFKSYIYSHGWLCNGCGVGKESPWGWERWCCLNSCCMNRNTCYDLCFKCYPKLLPTHYKPPTPKPAFVPMDAEPFFLQLANGPWKRLVFSYNVMNEMSRLFQNLDTQKEGRLTSSTRGCTSKG